MNLAVPLTTLDIPQPDRMRMMRSMRKLSSVLGEIPVVEVTRAPPPISAGQRRAFLIHSPPSLSLLADPFQKPILPQDTHIYVRPSLVLRVPHTPPPPSPHSPLSPHSPPSPSFSPTAESPLRDSDRRRLRLAKVSRTFGEHVPPELVFAEPLRRQRRATMAGPEFEHHAFAAAEATVAATSPIPKAPEPLWLLRIPKRLPA
ncbi:hypothetical protein B0H12DRAFT_1146844 [Mycena haematopus]|nr:hypothetical protein B0H12DRAFT_1146844 [Mycena haematopus]